MFEVSLGFLCVLYILGPDFIELLIIRKAHDMAKAKSGDTVKVHYTGKLDDGNVFDSSRERDPLELTLGSGQVIPGFDKGIEGMEVGESKTVEIATDDAYGPYRDDWLLEVDRSEFPDDMKPEVGQQLQMQQPNGQTVIVSIAAITETHIKLDANHPLAGKDLTFEIELMEIS